MVYKVLDVESLISATTELDGYYASFSKRCIVPELDTLKNRILGQKKRDAPMISEDIPSLEERYRHKILLSKKAADKERLKQIACIGQTVSEMFSVQMTTHTAQEVARQTILGAVVYRLLRIDTQYNTGLLSPFWGASTNSALQQSMFDVLGIKQIKELDAQTVLSSLEAYQKYLNQGRIKEAYVYIKDHADFLPDLDAMILKRQSEQSNTEQFLIRFIQSVNTQSGIYEASLEAVWSALGVAMATKTFPMDKKAIVSCLKEDISGMLASIIPEDCVLDSAARIPEFIAFFQARMKNRFHHSLYGAYFLALKYSQNMLPAMTNMLNFAIQSTPDNRPDNKAQRNALSALRWLLRHGGECEAIDTRVWNGMEGLKQQLIQQLSEVMNRESTPDVSTPLPALS